MTDTQNIENALKFVQDKYSDSNTSFELVNTQNYHKINRISWGQTSVYCFIAIKDFSNKKLGQVKYGDIFKPDSWTQPAKHSRGTIFDVNTWNCFEQYGIRYLR